MNRIQYYREGKISTHSRGISEGGGAGLRERLRLDIIEEQATLAQLVERLIRNQQVAGSTPAGGSTFSIPYKLTRHRVGFN